MEQGAGPATLLDLLKALARRPRLLAACALVGAALGLASALRAPQIYEGQVLLRMGQLPHAISMVDAREPRDWVEALQMRMVETPELASQRIQTVAFVASAGLPGDPEQHLDAIDVRAIRGTDILTVRYRASTPEAAEKGLRALVDTLKQRHEQLAQAGRARAQEELKLLAQLREETANRRREILQSTASRSDVPALVMAMAVSDDSVRWEAGLRAALRPELTRATAPVENIVASRRQNNPARIMQVVAGALAGLLVAAGIILVQHLAQRRRTQR